MHLYVYSCVFMVIFRTPIARLTEPLFNIYIYIYNCWIFHYDNIPPYGFSIEIFALWQLRNENEINENSLNGTERTFLYKFKNTHDPHFTGFFRRLFSSSTSIASNSLEKKQIVIITKTPQTSSVETMQKHV